MGGGGQVTEIPSREGGLQVTGIATGTAGVAQQQLQQLEQHQQQQQQHQQQPKANKKKSKKNKKQKPNEQPQQRQATTSETLSFVFDGTGANTKVIFFFGVLGGIGNGMVRYVR